MQDFFMFTTDNVFQVEYSSIINHENAALSLINIKESSNTVINNYTCTNSEIPINPQNDGSCAKIVSQKPLNFNFTNAFISNKSSYNGYIIEYREKSITAVQQSSQIKIQQYLYLSNITVSNLFLQSLTQLDQVSFMLIHHNQNALVSIRDFNSSNVKISTSQTPFIEYGVLIYIFAPTSMVEIQNIQLKNFDSNSPYSLIMINSQQISIQDSTFSGINHFLQDNLLRGSGFFKVLSQYTIINNCTFEKGRFQDGGALNILLNDQIQQLYIYSCKFEDFVTMQSGASIFFQNEAFQLKSEIFNVTFNQSYAINQGGVVYLKGSSQTQLVGSSIIFLNNSIFDTYAFSSGSFIFANLAQIIIQNSTMTQNNPSKIIQFQIFYNLDQLFCQMGSMIDVISCQLNIEDSTIQNLKSVVSIPCKPLIILAQSFSNITISQTQISQIIQDFNGLITIKQSNIQIVDSSFTQIQDKKTTGSGQSDQENSISSIIKSEFGIQKNSAINILQQSYYFFDSSVFQNIRCQYDDFCYAGVLVIQDSGGKIRNSSFDHNFSKNNGGAISMLNLLSVSEILSSNFTNNEALKNGGAIYVQRNQGKLKMQIDKSIFSSNNAFSGGGLYLDIASATQNYVQDFSIKESIISQNQAKLAGGGITYLVKKPFLLNTIVEDNKAIQIYGKNLFSGPVRIRLNLEKTLQCNDKKSINQNVFLKIQSLSSVTYSIHNQVSGQDLPCLIFSYIDENGLEINETYNQFSDTIVQLTLYKQISGNIDYNIISNQRVFQYQGYFNISNVRIQGTPNSTIVLNFTSNLIQYQGQQTYYTLFLEVNLRQCKQGEIMIEIAQKQKGYQNIYECYQCAQGEYSLIQPNIDDHGECKKCSPYAICEGGNQITIKPGYWRSSDQSDSILFCINNPLNCLGGKYNKTCEVGHIGPLCEECDSNKGYVQYGKLQCFQCESTIINIIKILVLLIIFVITQKLIVSGILEKLEDLWKKKLFGNRNTTNKSNKQNQNINSIKFSSQKLLSLNHLKKSSFNTLKSQPLQEEQYNHDTGVILKFIINHLQILAAITQFQINLPEVLNQSIQSSSNPTENIFNSIQCILKDLQSKTEIRMIYLQQISFSKQLDCLSVEIQVKFFNQSIKINSLLKIQNEKDGVEYIQANVVYRCYTEEYTFFSRILVIPVLLLVSIVIPSWLLCMNIQPFKINFYNKIDKTSIFILFLSFFLGFVAYKNFYVKWVWITSIVSICFLNFVFLIWTLKILILAQFDELLIYLRQLSININLISKWTGKASFAVKGIIKINQENKVIIEIERIGNQIACKSDNTSIFCMNEKVSSNSLCRGNLYLNNISESTIQDHFSAQQLRPFPYIPSKQLSRTIINQSNFAQYQVKKDYVIDPPNSPN
ncbi:transmembrane protein, putative (macronuclear) [Tetrahymena thermophila SB210]|uniref:Transmembrane protein, putative n=1 Tax=Tetrahymena thermophila (strain SB210) TaxID=312017 RepID=Q22BQ7_TETTS|nr:transmembrane protein, putative [Tetrahymena thermophila SB210]EAR82732.1 transmembrane protein, putative [Tetrahymena thermophila SB210]|eukprot:XP_001030395.1 transmembrane protein, putative [Tetrahymena thermophila SB210]